jgi:hypothetical protein
VQLCIGPYPHAIQRLSSASIAYLQKASSEPDNASCNVVGSAGCLPIAHKLLYLQMKPASLERTWYMQMGQILLVISLRTFKPKRLFLDHLLS